jgi:hypothetical protein
LATGKPEWIRIGRNGSRAISMGTMIQIGMATTWPSMRLAGQRCVVYRVLLQARRNGFVSSATASVQSHGKEDWMGTAVPNPRKSGQSVAKKDDKEFEKLTNGKPFASIRVIRG